jgi:hypothetical protein
VDDELPEDPDWDDVPDELRALDGQRVTLLGVDSDGEPAIEQATLCVVPHLWADGRRYGDDLMGLEPD